MFPEPRRISQYFDYQEEDPDDALMNEIEIEDGDMREWMRELQEEEDEAGNPEVDIYLARNEMGFRKLPVHDFSVIWQQLPF
ncbi:MAG: hypothetical protein LR015_03790 [Verrucomicrobia bacterium]|nr:hypothetical protein [Verrucomicrobiota bacterium]